MCGCPNLLRAWRKKIRILKRINSRNLPFCPTESERRHHNYQTQLLHPSTMRFKPSFPIPHFIQYIQALATSTIYRTPSLSNRCRITPNVPIVPRNCGKYLPNGEQSREKFTQKTRRYFPHFPSFIFCMQIKFVFFESLFFII